MSDSDKLDQAPVDQLDQATDQAGQLEQPKADQLDQVPGDQLDPPGSYSVTQPAPGFGITAKFPQDDAPVGDDAREPRRPADELADEPAPVEPAPVDPTPASVEQPAPVVEPSPAQPVELPAQPVEPTPVDQAGDDAGTSQ